MRIQTLLFLAALLAPAAAQAQAVRFLLAVGDVFVNRDASQIKAGPGTTVESGDSIRVGLSSSAPIRLSDESIISLRQNTIFRLDEYSYSGQADGNEKSFFSLLKGGFRTVTGAIGRLHSREKYQVRTATSTIGIRGTHYVVVHCDNDCGADTKISLAMTASTQSDAGIGELAQAGGPGAGSFANGTYGGVSDGRIDVGNNAGSKEFGANEYFHVPNANTAPQGLVAPPGFLYDRLQAQSRRQGNAGNETVPSGSGSESESRSSAPITPLSPVGAITTTQPPTPLPAGTFTIALVGALTEVGQTNPNQGGGFSTASDLQTSGTGTSQILLGFSLPSGSNAGGGGGSGGGVTADSGGAGNVTNNTVANAIGANWRRWNGGTFVNDSGTTTTFSNNNQFHYLYGPLTPPEVIAAKTGSFSLSVVGGTPVTFSAGSTIGTSFNLGPPTLDFTGRTVSASSVSLSSGTPGFNTFSFPSGFTAPIQIAAAKCAFTDMKNIVGTCSGSIFLTSTPAQLGVTGIFMGPKGDHLGTSWSAITTSGPSLSAQTVKLLTCAPSC